MAISSLSAANTEICDGQQLSNVPKNFRRLIMTSLQCRLTPVTGNHTLAQWMLLTSITLRPEPVNSARLRSPPKYSQPCTAELSALRTKYYNESYDYLLGLGSMQMQTLSQHYGRQNNLPRYTRPARHQCNTNKAARKKHPYF